MNNSLDISAIILTKNEELHIQRCIENLNMVCSRIYVVDSFSTDRTCEIAAECGAVVLQNKYVNQAQQFQWALDNCPVDTAWVMRMDADEYLTDELIDEISIKLPNLSSDVTGVNFIRNVRFLGRTLRYGNMKPISIMRLWRVGSAYMEQRWMDERIVLKYGEAVTFNKRFIDENLNGLTAWTEKHNDYSNREIVTELDRLYGLFESGSDDSLVSRNKQKSLYYKLPRFVRAAAYFIARYVFFLGFLDGVPGLIWLTLQAYWYRFLVDAKLKEMECRLGPNPTREQVADYVMKYYNIKVDNR